MYCVGCLACVNLAAIITTAVFRFNTAGKLAALSLTSSKYDGKEDGVVKLSAKITFKDDAKLILGIWIAMTVYCCCSGNLCCKQILYKSSDP